MNDDFQARDEWHYDTDLRDCEAQPGSRSKQSHKS
jgi:hypothetical protein